MAENILDFLLKQRQPPEDRINITEVGNNAMAIAKGELPPGTDMQAFIGTILSKQDETRAQADELNTEVMRLVTGQGVLEAQVSQGIENLSTSQAEALREEEQMLATQGEINLSNTRRGVLLDAELQAAIDARDGQRQADEDVLNATFEEMVRDYDVVKEAASDNIFDLVQNPIKTIQNKIAAVDAEQRLEVNSNKVATLDAKNQLNTRMHQQKVDSYNVERTLAQIKDIDLYEKNQTLVTSTNIMKARNANFTQVVENLSKFYGLKQDQLSGVEAQLRILNEQGRLTATAIDNVMKEQQYKYAVLQYNETKRQYEENENVRETYDAKFAEIGRVMGIPEISSFAGYTAAVESGMITQDVQTVAQTIFSQGTIGTPAVFNAVNSSRTAQAIMATEPGLIPERMQEFLLTVDQHIKNSADYAAVMAESDTKRQQEGIENIRNNYLKTWRASLDVDVDVATRTKLWNIMSPNNMDLTKVAGIHTDTLETFQKMRLNTSSFDAFAADAINVIVGDPLTSQIKPSDYTKYAEGLAALSKYQFDGLNRDTGLALQHMRNNRFVNPITGRPGDARNPNDWLTLLQQRRQNIINRSAYQK